MKILEIVILNLGYSLYVKVTELYTLMFFILLLKHQFPKTVKNMLGDFFNNGFFIYTSFIEVHNFFVFLKMSKVTVYFLKKIICFFF